MKYYRCSCGHTLWFTSIGVPNCSKCPECGSSYMKDPITGKYLPVLPHDWVKRYDESSGEPYQICSKCMERRNEV